MDDETDAEVLARLRCDPNCPADVLLLAEQASRKGLLAAANERAEAETWEDAVGSSRPDSQLTSLSRTFYSGLRADLQKVLGFPVSAQSLGED